MRSAMGCPWTVLDLDLWLLYATRDPEADRRVRAEITAHFQDALAAGREAGLSDTEAERQALSALGHPEKARKRFLKTYLCTDDLKKIADLQKYLRTPREMARQFAKGILIFSPVWLSLIFIPEYFGEKIELLYIWMMWCLFYSLYDLLLSLRARFLFSPYSESQERRFMKTVMIFWPAVVILFSGFIFFSSGRSFPHGVISGRNKMILGITAGFVLLSLVLVAVGLVVNEYSVYISLKRKIGNQKKNADEPGPDQYA